MRYGLKEKELDIIVNILQKHIHDNDVVIFGSRSRGDFHRTSDIDLAITAKISATELAKLRTLFEESSLIYTVDLVAIDSITSTSFKESINKDAKNLAIPNQQK